MNVTAACDETASVLADFLSELRSPLALHVSHLLASGKHEELLSLVADSSSETFRDDYLAVEVMSKYPYLNVPFNREAVAWNKFREIEVSLVYTDNRLFRFLKGWGKENPTLHAVFHMARRKIESLLGDFFIECAEWYFDFGPGATVSLPRRRANAPNKFGNKKPTVTQNCLDLAISALSRNQVWLDYQISRNGPNPENWFRLVPGNKVVTVPKSAKTDRTIAIEPDMNLFIQKGIGGLIRRKLKSVGVDLNSQLLNQQLAEAGSISGNLATIDMSSASDTVSLLLVEELLPPSWVDAIKASRSPRGLLPDGTMLLYRKVSSMGNGFTFELESLIFWALASSCIYYSRTMDLRCGVYGDDLIVSVDAAPLLIECLSLCGFTTNSKKTHVSGWFRESCGKHFLRGEDVTPFYVKKRIDTIDRKYWFLNSLSVWSGTQYQFQFRDSRCEASWNRVFNTIPPDRRALGPLFLGGSMSTTCIGVPFDQACPSRHSFGWDGYVYHSFHKVQRELVANSIGSLIAFTDRFGRSYLRPRCETSRLTGRPVWVFAEAFTQQWQEIGPWLATKV